MTIPFFRPSIGDDEIQSVIEVMRSGWLTTGPKTKEFEARFASYLGDGVEAVAVNSATAALHLAAEACGVGPGVSVLVPTMTFTATAEVVRYLGGEVVLVDVEPGTLVIDLEQAERRLTPSCKVVMPVHFGGYPCDMRAMSRFAERHGLRVIEDAAHSFPASRDGALVGAHNSDACAFSFYANKTMTTGEGGMLTTRNPDIASRARLMRTHGIDRDSFDRFKKVGVNWEYDVVAPGYKYNMTDIAAAVGVVQLAKAETMRAQREAVARLYLEALSGLPIDLPPPAPDGALHAWHIFPVRIREEARTGRDGVIEALTAAGVGTSVHYRPLHRMRYWSERYPSRPGEFPVADRHFDGVVTLPLFPSMSVSEVEQVASIIRSAVA